MDALIDVRPRLLAALSQMCGLDPADARRLLCFSAGVHDLGKFGDDFQSKVPYLWQGRETFAAERSLLEPPAGSGHGVLGGAIWTRATAAGAEFASLWTVTPWTMAAFAHHGRPVDGVLPDFPSLISKTALADAAALVCAMVELFQPQAVLRSTEAKRSAWIVAGLTILADWLGSNQTWFPYREPTLAMADYWPITREQAARAVRKSGLAEALVAARFGLAEALGARTPREPINATPLQAWATEQSFEAPSLVILEDLTGAGKTEAGLILAHAMMRDRLAEGLYWALPTMATADSLHERLERAYRALFEGGRPSLVLAHSARDLNDRFFGSIAGPGASDEHYPNGEDETIKDGPASASCAAWIADDRRTAFLAEVGVGTIDQALLGVLPVKHQSLRLAGLARRVLIIDEAHAYQEYENRLLERLIEFQAAAGGSVVVLSATLPLDRRRRYVEAFGKGKEATIAAPDNPAFPAATTVSAGRAWCAPVEGEKKQRGARRDLPVRQLDAEDEADTALLAAAAGSGCAAWVRNTVQDAIDTAARLREASGREVMLFHARFALGDRLKRQDEVLTRFGKTSRAADRSGRLLVATQVIEQSIDCDWDQLLSDLAPIDLLIQRAGRLQRHDRGPRPSPVLQVLGPEARDDADEDWYARLFPRGQRVYDDHGRLWLTQRTMEAFGGLPLLGRSPRDLIEAVYGRDPPWPIPPGLQRRSDRAEGERVAHRSVAFLNGLDVKKGFTLAVGAWESDTRTPTRLGDPTRTVRLARWDGTAIRPWIGHPDPRRAWRMSEVSLRASRVAEPVFPEAACKAAVDAEVARWPERRFDPPLVLPLVEGDDRTWIGAVEDVRGRRFGVAYDSADGLRFIDA